MKKRLQRIYIDTSVAGGYFDEEFADATRKFFSRARKGEIIILTSFLLDEELINAPQRVRNLISRLSKDSTEKIQDTAEARWLADEYVKEKVVGKTSIADCLHIAIATICKAELLVSWNFKHIVNVERINGYNSVNLKHGYKTIDIRTPKEVLHYEN